MKDGEEIFTKTDESVTESSTFSSKKEKRNIEFMKRLLSFVLSAALIVSGTYAANSMHISADEASSVVGSSATSQTELDPASSPQITEEPGAVPDDTPQVSGQPTVKPDDAPQVSGQPTVNQMMYHRLVGSQRQCRATHRRLQ